MAIAYSYDLRIRALSLIDAGKKITSVAEILNIKRCTLHTWIKLRNANGDFRPKENWQKGYGHKITDLIAFKKFVDENRDLTLTQIAQKLGNVKRSSVHRAMKKIYYVKKKDVWVY